MLRIIKRSNLKVLIKYYIKRIKSLYHDYIEIIKHKSEQNNYTEQINNNDVSLNKRYVSIGFDDFRESDFDLIIPILKKYNYTATFNRVQTTDYLTINDKKKMDTVLKNGNEIGDHTFFHCNYIFTDALMNGQDPSKIEGIQEPFPSNEEMREEFHDGKNVFGIDINSRIKDADFGWYTFSNNISIESTWKNLTNEECQKLRDLFSIYKDKSGMLFILDKLSHKYCGTKGNSYGSYSIKKGCYTKGIFTGAKTSCNHEIWERLILISKNFYKEKYNKDFNFITWSFPGDWRSPFKYYMDGNFYYDKQYSKLFNYLARFESSINGTYRSFTDVLNNSGYKITHDTYYPSRVDGTETVMMSNQLILNASISRKNALCYGTNTITLNNKIEQKYNEKFFSKKNKSIASQMYDEKGVFYELIENTRHNTNNGMIEGEIVDSENTYSEKIFFDEFFKFCKNTGIELISKAKAYNICFNHNITSGNLIYNPNFKNSIKDYFKDSDSIPNNPDGYKGNCFVQYNKKSILIIQGMVIYLHFGIPLGNIKYTATMKGIGTVKIYAIKNSDSVKLDDNQLFQLSIIKINSNVEKQFSSTFIIKDNPETEYEQICAGLGNKIMGIKIVYNGDIAIHDILLKKI